MNFSIIDDKLQNMTLCFSTYRNDIVGYYFISIQIILIGFKMILTNVYNIKEKSFEMRKNTNENKNKKDFCPG